MRVLLGAFGDPGHAFPMLALGRALRARGHEVTLQTWERWREDAGREGLALRGGAGVPRVPHAGAAAEAATRRWRGRRARRGRWCASLGARRGRGGHPDAGAGAGGGARGGAGRRRSCRTSTRASSPGWPPYSIGRAAAAHRRRARGLARRSTRWSGAGWSSGGASSTRRGGGSGCAPSGRRVRRDLASGSCSWRRSRSSSTRGAWRCPGRTSSVRCCGSRSPGRRAAAGRRAARAGRAVDGAGRRAPAAARGARRASADMAGARAGDVEPARAGPAARDVRARTRGSSSGSATRARCRAATSSSATAGTGRSCARWRAAARSSSRPAAGDRTRTRRGWTGPARACGSRGGLSARRSVRLAVRRALDGRRDARASAGARRVARASTIRARGRRSWSRRAERARPAYELVFVSVDGMSSPSGYTEGPRSRTAAGPDAIRRRWRTG